MFWLIDDRHARHLALFIVAAGNHYHLLRGCQ
jgi:hypothetical protein